LLAREGGRGDEYMHKGRILKVLIVFSG